MNSEGIIISGKNGIWEWKAPIDYGSVVFDGAGLFPNAGTFYHDASARKNNGTLVNGPTWQYVPELGRWGTTHVRASSQYIATPARWNGGAGTIAAWFLFNTTTDFQGSGQYTSTGDSDRFYMGCHSTDVSVIFGRANLTLTVDVNLQPYTWRHLAQTCDGARIRSYVDGSEVGDATYTYASGTSTFRIGSIPTADWPLGGQTSGFIFSSTALSPAQIQWLANPGNNPWQPWRRKWWPVVSAPTPATSRNVIIGGGVI